MDSSTAANGNGSGASGGSNNMDFSNGQLILPSQGHSIFIVNPVIIPHQNYVSSSANSREPCSSSSHPLSSNSSFSTGNKDNAISGEAGSVSGILTSDEPNDLMNKNQAELPSSLRKAYDYINLASEALKSAVFEMNDQLEKQNSKIDKLNTEKSVSEQKYLAISEDKDKMEKELEAKLAKDRVELKKLRQELGKLREKLQRVTESYKLQEECLKEERKQGMKKTEKLQEMSTELEELSGKFLEKEKELKDAVEMKERVVDEYWAYFTKPTTLNKLVHQQMALTEQRNNRGKPRPSKHSIPDSNKRSRLD